MRITTSVIEDDIVLIEVAGEVNARTARRLEETFSGLLAQGHSRLVLDASHMEYISSAGLQVLLDAQREARQVGGEVRLTGPNAFVWRVIKLAGFEKLLHVSDTRQNALENW